MRLIPPRPATGERWSDTEQRQASMWLAGLRRGKRRGLWMLLGNALLLSLLLGLPFLRGRRRARKSEHAYAALSACLFAAPPDRVQDARELEGEAEAFAAHLLRDGPTWLPRCEKMLESIAPAPAFFVLPSVKAAEAQVREAVSLVRGELHAASAYKVGMPLPERPLRALRLLRKAIREQLVQADFELEVGPAPARKTDPGLAAPSRIPLYAAPDAVLSLWGDDHALYAVGLDATGLSYIDATPGRPWVRARLVRPGSLRAFLRSGTRPWLLWATPQSRCAERFQGCYAKATQVAVAPLPLLELPPPRALAGHLAGRADRSVAEVQNQLWLATATRDQRSVIQQYPWPQGYAGESELPVLKASKRWAVQTDDALLLSTQFEAVVLGMETTGQQVRLLRLGPDLGEPLAALDADDHAWMTGCGDDGVAGFAFGNGTTLLVGQLSIGPGQEKLRMWQPLPLASQAEIHPTRPALDRMVRVCARDAALLLARDNHGRLVAIVCRKEEAQCRLLPLATEVQSFSAVTTPHGALVAYAGDVATQIRLRKVDARELTVSDEVVPGACWDSARGLCGVPTLARLGSRIVLVARERTDLAALESPDEGRTWTPVPVL